MATTKKPAKKVGKAKTSPSTKPLEAKKTGAEGKDKAKVAQSDTKSKPVPKSPDFDRPVSVSVSPANTSSQPQKSVGLVGNPNIAEYGKSTQFKPGNNANPGGKPVGSRNKLQGDFMRELCEDFAANGRKAIIACRTEKPDAYVKIIASLMPKEFEIKRPLEELSEDELVASVGALQAFLNGQKPASKNTH